MYIHKSFSVFSLILLMPLLLLAQNETDKPVFVPEQGIEGKDVIWWPTPHTLINAMLDKAEVGQGDFVVDLGSGDGRIVIEAAKRGATAIGIEYNPDLVRLSEHRAKIEGVADKASFLNMDLFEYDLSKATVVTMYLLSDLNMKLRPSLLKLKPGTRIVSNTFDLDDWEADDTILITTEYKYPDGTFRNNITNRGYYWVVPACVDSSWKMEEGVLRLFQKFQMIEGTLTNATGTLKVEGKLKGNSINFTANDIEYQGYIENDVIKGTVTKAGVVSDWQAKRQ